MSVRSDSARNRARLDGLRATDRPPLPAPAPPVEALQMIMKAGKR